MPLRLFLEPEARDDLADAFTWYERQRSGLGSEFLAEVALVFEAIEGAPERYAIVRSRTRRVLVHRFPYTLRGVVHNLRNAVAHFRFTPIHRSGEVVAFEFHDQTVFRATLTVQEAKRFVEAIAAHLQKAAA
jgi:hypothetical protein